nr:MAG TPA: hypothetical protein [Caudoviricetes sp.]
MFCVGKPYSPKGYFRDKMCILSFRSLKMSSIISAHQQS